MTVTIYTGDTAVRNVTLQNTGSAQLMDSVIKISHGVPVSGAILINEIAGADPLWDDYIELINTGSSDVNIGGYRLVWTDNTGTSGSYTIPAGTIIKAHRCMFFVENTGTANDSTLFIGLEIGWGGGTQLSVSLLNASAQGVDFFKTSGDATTPPAGTTWSGSGYVPTGSEYTYYRTGVVDNNNAGDWASTTSSTPGTLNPGQNFSIGVTTGYITATQDSFHINAGQGSAIRFKYDATSLMTSGIYIDTFQIIENSKNVASPITVICTLIVKSNIPVIIPYQPDPTINRRPVLSWHPVVSASVYTLEVSQTSSFSTLQIMQQTADTSFSPLADFPLGTIYWRVRCNLSPRTSLPDDFYIQSDSIPLLIPIVPDTLGMQTSTLFSWHRSTGATTYRIMIYDIDSTVPQPVVLTYVTDTFYLHGITLQTGRYRWTVSANFDYNRTAYPDTFWVKIPPAVLPGEKSMLPKAYALKAYAASGGMRISCAIPRQPSGRACAVTIDMFDIRGKMVRLIYSGTLEAGYHQLPASVENVASGIYYCRMRAGSQQKTVPLYLKK